MLDQYASQNTCTPFVLCLSVYTFLDMIVWSTQGVQRSCTCSYEIVMYASHICRYSIFIHHSIKRNVDIYLFLAFIIMCCGCGVWANVWPSISDISYNRHVRHSMSTIDLCHKINHNVVMHQHQSIHIEFTSNVCSKKKQNQSWKSIIRLIEFCVAFQRNCKNKCVFSEVFTYTPMGTSDHFDWGHISECELWNITSKLCILFLESNMHSASKLILDHG